VIVVLGLIVAGGHFNNVGAYQVPTLQVDDLTSCLNVQTDADGVMTCGPAGTGGTGNMTWQVYDTDHNGTVDYCEVALDVQCSNCVDASDVAADVATQAELDALDLDDVCDVGSTTNNRITVDGVTITDGNDLIMDDMILSESQVTVARTINFPDESGTIVTTYRTGNIFNSPDEGNVLRGTKSGKTAWSNVLALGVDGQIRASNIQIRGGDEGDEDASLVLYEGGSGTEYYNRLIASNPTAYRINYLPDETGTILTDASTSPWDLDDVCDVGSTTDQGITVLDLEVSTPNAIYNLSHDSFADFTTAEHFTMLDEDMLSSDDATKAATQQSIKAYIASASASIDEADEITMEYATSSSYNNVQEWSNMVQSAGLLVGGTLSDNGDGSLSVAGGSGFAKTTDSETGITTFITWATDNSVSLTDNAKNTVYIDYNGGSPFVESTTTPSATIDHTTKFPIGAVWRNGTTLHIVNAGTRIYNWARRGHRRARELRKYERASGLALSETGTRSIATTAGVVYAGYDRLTLAEVDTSDGDTFTAYYRDAGDSWTTVEDQTQIDNVKYDDGDGTLGDVANNKYGVHWVYLDNDGHLLVQYGQGSYKLAEAIEAGVPPAPEYLNDFAIIIGKIIILRDAPSFTSVLSAFVTQFEMNVSVNHNDLGGIQGGTNDEYYHLTSAEHTGFFNKDVHDSDDITEGTSHYFDDDGVDANTNADTECSGDTTYYSGEGNCNDLDNQYVELTDSVGVVADVDTTTDPPERDDVLKWNGNNWVAAAYDYSFVFDFDTFSDGQSSPQLLGSGIWKDIGAITFTASYSNGPPTSCVITIAGDFDGGSGSGWTDDELEMDDGDKTSESTDEATNYPDDSGDTISFNAVADTLTPDSNDYQVTFYNYFIHDDFASNNGFDDGDLDTIASGGTQIVTSDHTRTFTQSIGDSNYLVFAHRKAGTTVTQVRCGTDSNALTVAMNKNDATAVTPLKETVSHSNAANNPKTEDFYVYASKEQNIDAHSSSFTTLTSSTVSNYLRAGLDDQNTGWSNADFLALTYKYASTSDETRTTSSLTPGANDYLVYMYPDGWGNLTVGTDYETDGHGTSFLFDGVTAAMAYEGLNNCTNEVGFQDSYRVYVSTGKDYGSGSGTLVGGSVQTLNPIYYGKTTDASGYNEADVEGCANSTISNDYTQVWDAVTLGSGEYGLWCFPKRMGSKGVEYTFWDHDTGFGFDFQDAETVSVTNYSNWTEDYYVYRTTNSNLGTITVETK